MVGYAANTRPFYSSVETEAMNRLYQQLRTWLVRAPKLSRPEHAKFQADVGGLESEIFRKSGSGRHHSPDSIPSHVDLVRNSLAQYGLMPDEKYLERARIDGVRIH